jgi:hypothetical protein
MYDYEEICMEVVVAYWHKNRYEILIVYTVLRNYENNQHLLHSTNKQNYTSFAQDMVFYLINVTIPFSRIYNEETILK